LRSWLTIAPVELLSRHGIQEVYGPDLEGRETILGLADDLVAAYA
jgi:hypothetical protein